MMVLPSPMSRETMSFFFLPSSIVNKTPENLITRYFFIETNNIFWKHKNRCQFSLGLILLPDTFSWLRLLLVIFFIVIYFIRCTYFTLTANFVHHMFHFSFHNDVLNSIFIQKSAEVHWSLLWESAIGLNLYYKFTLLVLRTRIRNVLDFHRLSFSSLKK